jgi:hypothetical protein
MDPPSLIAFSLRGKKITTTWQTLSSRGEENMLCKIVRNHFAGTVSSPMDGDALFIDRNPQLFHDVLDVLNGVDLTISDRLRTELVYFAIEPQPKIEVSFRSELRQLFLMSVFGIIRDTLMAALKDEALAGRTSMDLSSFLSQSVTSVVFRLGPRTFMLDQVSVSRCRTGWHELGRLIEINLGLATSSWFDSSLGQYFIKCDWSREDTAAHHNGLEMIHSLLESMVGLSHGQKALRVLQ